MIKANRPSLHRRLRSLPWKDVTARRYDREVGHGRRETRVTRALTVTDPGLGFSHAARAVRILRHRTDLTTDKVSHQTVYAITNLTSHQVPTAGRGQAGRVARMARRSAVVVFCSRRGKMRVTLWSWAVASKLVIASVTSTTL
ncbi:hypothetical protein SAMN05414137_10727 [Streptacidiphilus jiangxiensis]|uniref:Uncharacterized protein n=1 Tax=Streptacidiphilus jiangxiensis TaxID=235985 RepID=A0A1H7NQY2_STRJI|nr:hypothetical protein SAMN05414137_10727 [Streptacidiphilus jiangxiensis]